MTIITAKIDLAEANITLKQWREFAKQFGSNSEWQIVKPYSRHMRNMLDGWQFINSVAEWSPKQGPNVPGTYAFCYDPKNKISNPIMCDATIIFGESTQPAWKRIASHVGAMNGRITNTSDKWQRCIPLMKNNHSVDILKDLKHIKIFFRPHNITDKDHQFDRQHSVLMETQAHAFYAAWCGHLTLGNTRDLPDDHMITDAKQCLKDLAKPGGFADFFKKSKIKKLLT